MAVDSGVADLSLAGPDKQEGHCEFALVQAFLADYLGNLSYALTARNFNPVIAMAADTVIASADNIVPVGVMSPDHVVTPAPVVDYLIAN